MEKPPITRRRLSTYRPHNWNYPILVLPVHEEGLSLEQLPVVILAAIFGHIKPPDLLNVCIASKYFYLPAVIQLYKRIVITNSILQNYADTFLTNWQLNIGTSVIAPNVAKLAAVLVNNEKLALLVQTIVVTERCDSLLLHQILGVTNVTNLYYLGEEPLPQNVLNNVRNLSTSIRSSLIAPMLTELHICSSGDDVNPEKYRYLALSMLDSNSYQNLRVLAFKNIEDRNLRMLNQMNDDDERPLAGWILFFGAFAERQTRLPVTNLILEGFVKNSGKDVAHLLYNSVEVENIHSLALLCTELSHAHSIHLGSNTTLLENLTKLTKNLSRLSISPTNDCLTCQVNAITATLKLNLPGQLLNLLVVFESPNTSISANVKLAILQSQSKLEMLRYSDKITLGGLKSEMYQLLASRVSEWEHGSFYNYRIRKAFFPNTFSYVGDVPFLSDPLNLLIQTMGCKISEVLNKDLVLRNASKMPNLRLYMLMEFPLSTKGCGFYVNGTLVSCDGKVDDV